MGKDDATQGLSGAEARARLEHYGPNALPEKPRTSTLRRLLRQFQSPLIYILLFALAIDLFIWGAERAGGIPFESVAIGLILALNAILGAYQEAKAENALARLKALAESMVWVFRDGEIARLPATALVPGDLVRVESGERVPADGSFVEAHGILVDESVLTGESVPVEKSPGDEAFSGTVVVRGKGHLELTKTGSRSAMGRLAEMLGTIETEKTPLERRLAVFGDQIARWVLGLAAAIAIGGTLIEGVSNVFHVLLFAVALAVAAVPEGLPAVLTLTLALGVERMAKRKAVVRRLSAVEALGSVTVIATDKTGTLTENRMRVHSLDSPDVRRALLALVLANDAEAGTDAGDPIEVALLAYARAEGVDLAVVTATHPRRGVVPFDSSYKFMRVSVEENGGLVSYLKGAPEVLLERCRSRKRNGAAGREGRCPRGDGFRLLALAWRDGEGDDEDDLPRACALWDPPRPEVPEAIRQARDAGLRIVMVTGDHPATAVAVARDVGIEPGRVVTGIDLDEMSDEQMRRVVEEANVFARVAPEHKLRLVEALKENGEIVAVTGDGVNDAPALKRADVGVSMGQRGSDVARDVSDLVLLDDNFASIVAAIEEGRNIYENIQRFIRFLFSTNLAEASIVVMGVLGSLLLGLREEDGGLLLPLTAVQLLWVNIVTDGPPALALGLDRNRGVMGQRPRDPSSRLLNRDVVRFIFVIGFAKALIGGVLLVMMPRAGFSLEVTRSTLFLYVTIGQLVLAYPARRMVSVPSFNLALHLSVFLGTALQLATVLVPWLRALLGLEALDVPALLWLVVTVGVSWGIAELYSRLEQRRSKGSVVFP